MLKGFLQIWWNDKVFYLIQGIPGTACLCLAHHFQTSRAHFSRRLKACHFLLVDPAPVAFGIALGKVLVITFCISLIGLAIYPTEAKGFIHCLVIVDRGRTTFFSVNDEPDALGLLVVFCQPLPPGGGSGSVKSSYSIFGFHDIFTFLPLFDHLSTQKY
jgi:hypothetical protein